MRNSVKTRQPINSDLFLHSVRKNDSSLSRIIKVFNNQCTRNLSVLEKPRENIWVLCLQRRTVLSFHVLSFPCSILKPSFCFLLSFFCFLGEINIGVNKTGQCACNLHQSDELYTIVRERVTETLLRKATDLIVAHTVKKKLLRNYIRASF
jgi:hypothetical protein